MTKTAGENTKEYSAHEKECIANRSLSPSVLGLIMTRVSSHLQPFGALL
jgi:hypothetical protein